jgi:TatD DNase family protein
MPAKLQPYSSLIDTHCHLDAPEFNGLRAQRVAQALHAGVTRIVVPSVAASSFASTLNMHQQYGCLIAFGLHPLYCAEHLDDHLSLLEQMLQQHQPLAVGEIGLDNWIENPDVARQEALFIEQLKLARKYDLPVILHIRRAQDRVLKYLRQFPVRGGIAHAFNGSEQQALAFIQLGFKLGFGGAMTFSGSRQIRRLAATLPLSSLVLETDAPDMRPEWAQDQDNQPANVARFAQCLAQLRAISIYEVAQCTTFNACAALNIPQQP